MFLSGALTSEFPIGGIYIGRNRNQVGEFWESRRETASGFARSANWKRAFSCVICQFSGSKTVVSYKSRSHRAADRVICDV